MQVFKLQMEEATVLDVKEKNSRVFDCRLDLAKEEHRLPAIDESVVVSEANIHHGADFDLQ